MYPRQLTMWHEAAHLAARHILGNIGVVDMVEVPESGDARRGAGARVSATTTIGDAIKTRETACREIVSILAGSAAMRELGLDDSGGEHDEELAGKIALAYCRDDVDAAIELYDVCVRRTERLVATEQFQGLQLRMGQELMGVPRMSGGRAAALLRGWDQTGRFETMATASRGSRRAAALGSAEHLQRRRPPP